ncbi:MAG: hypothetical protein ABFD97_19705 [Syntrophobacter sp.]
MLDLEKNLWLTDKCSRELALLQKRAAEIDRNLAQELLSNIETGIESTEAERLRFEVAQVEQRTADLLIVLRELKKQRKWLRPG